MTQTDGNRRTVPGAELFFGESVAQYLADLSDDVFSEEGYAEGLLLGRRYRDDLGQYVIISRVTQDMSRTADAVGWFKSSESCDIDQNDISRMVSLFGYIRMVSLFGYIRVYAIAVDYAQGSMAMYSVENGAARKVPSAMVENL